MWRGVIMINVVVRVANSAYFLLAPCYLALEQATAVARTRKWRHGVRVLIFAALYYGH